MGLKASYSDAVIRSIWVISVPKVYSWFCFLRNQIHLHFLDSDELMWCGRLHRLLDLRFPIWSFLSLRGTEAGSRVWGITTASGLSLHSSSGREWAIYPKVKCSLCYKAAANWTGFWLYPLQHSLNLLYPVLTVLPTPMSKHEHVSCQIYLNVNKSDAFSNRM